MSDVELRQLRSCRSNIARHELAGRHSRKTGELRQDLIIDPVVFFICVFSSFQAQIASDEAIAIGDLQCTKVSAELKSARSVVRITEITATLQEQKYVFPIACLPAFSCESRLMCRIASLSSTE